MLLKKEMLINMIEERTLKSCTLIGVPTKELQEVWFKNGDLLNLFERHNIKYKLGKFEDSSVSIYFPNFLNTQLTELCAITINDPTIEQIINITKSLFSDTLEYYQVAVPPVLINKIIGIYQEPLTFADMLLIIPEKSQSKIAEKVGKSRQAIGDIKSGKNNLTIEILSKLMRLYPLLPWSEFVECQK
ncbi:helix-turn-helix transcriptional regulator [Clostridium perfringens]|nr:helix-turn-helix transcriptional regulator [Clostridium perfringens]